MSTVNTAMFLGSSTPRPSVLFLLLQSAGQQSLRRPHPVSAAWDYVIPEPEAFTGANKSRNPSPGKHS